MKKSTLIVIVVFVVLLIAAVVINDRPAQKGAESISFVDLDIEEIDGLNLETTDGRLELKRQDGVWRLANDRLADPDKLKRALEGLMAIDSSDVVSTAETRQAAYGVDPDSGMTVEANEGSKKRIRIVVGSSESGGDFLRRVGDEVIFQANPGMKRLFPIDETSWVQMKLVGGTLDEFEKIEFRPIGEQTFTLLPGADDKQWTLQDPSILPEGFRFDGTIARSLANTVVTARAKEIVEDAPEALGLASEHTQIVATKAGKEVVLYLGGANEGGDSFAKVDGRDEVFLMPSYQAKNLAKTLAELRDMRLMTFDPAAANTMQITSGKKVFAFMMNEGGQWDIRPEGEQPPEELKYDATAVTRLLSSIPNLRATSIAEGVSEKAAGLAKPSTRVEVGLTDGTLVALEFGATRSVGDSKKEVFARGNADERIYSVPEFQLNRFTRGWESFEVVEPPPNMGGNPWGNLDPETLKNLPPDVRESIMKQMLEQQQKQQMMQQMQQMQGQ